MCTKTNRSTIGCKLIMILAMSVASFDVFAQDADSDQCDVLLAQLKEDAKQHPSHYWEVHVDIMAEPVGGIQAIWHEFERIGLKRISRRGMVVQYFVDEHGDVRCPVAFQSNYPDLTVDVLEAIRRVKYKPSMRDGKPVLSRMSAVFSLIEVE